MTILTHLQGRWHPGQAGLVKQAGRREDGDGDLSRALGRSHGASGASGECPLGGQMPPSWRCGLAQPTSHLRVMAAFCYLKW